MHPINMHCKLFHMGSPVFWLSSYSKESFKLIAPTWWGNQCSFFKRTASETAIKLKHLTLSFCWKIFSYQNWRKSICFTTKLEVLTIFQSTIWNSQWFSGKPETAVDLIYTCKQEKLPQSITQWMEQAQNGLKYVDEYMRKTFFCWTPTSLHHILTARHAVTITHIFTIT